jgi:hypothetical protein
MIYGGRRNRFSRGRIIWLLHHPSPTSVGELDGRHTGRLRKRENLLAEGGRGDGVGANIEPQESLVLYILYNSLCISSLVAL